MRRLKMRLRLVNQNVTISNRFVREFFTATVESFGRIAFFAEHENSAISIAGYDGILVELEALWS